MRLLYPLALLALGIQCTLLFALLWISNGVFPWQNGLAWLLLALLLVVPPAALFALGRRGQRQLETAEKRVLDFAEASSDYFWETNAAQAFTWFSARFEQVTGMDPSQLLGKSRLEAIDTSRDPDKWVRHQQTLKTHQPFRNFDFETQTPTGEHRMFRIGGNPVFDADGHFAGYRGSGLNITEAVRAQRSEARLLRAIDNLPDAVALYDEADRLLTCNNAYREHFLGDVSLQPHVGRTFRQILETNVSKQHVPANASVDHVDERTRRHQRADGTPVVMTMPDGGQLVARDFRMHDGGIMTLVSDHTELAEREARLEFTEQRLRDFLETAADWFWETDAQGHFTSVSDRYFAVMGFEPYAVLGHTRDELPGRAAPDQGRMRLNEMMANHEVIRQVTYTRTDAKGQSRLLRISGKPLFDESGTFVGYRGTGNDVTATEQARAEAHQAETRFKESLEYSADGIALYDANDKLVIWNRVYAERYLLGRAMLEVGTTFETVLQLGLAAGTMIDVARDSAGYQQRLQRHGDATGEPHRYLRKDGRWSEIREFRTSEGGVLLVITDVTSQMRTYELTRSLAVRVSGQREEFLSAVLLSLCQATGMGSAFIALARPDGTLTTQCVISAGELSENFSFDAGASLCGQSVLSAKPVMREDLRRTHPSDLLVARFGAVGMLALPTPDTSGKALGLLVLMQDDTEVASDLLETLPSLVAERFGAEFEHEATQQALVASERDLRAVLDNSPVQVALKDSDGQYLRVNRQWCAFNNIDKDVVGQTVEEVFGKAPWVDKSNESDRKVFSENRTITEELIRPSDDGPRSVVVQRFPVRDEAGEPIGLGVAAMDMTNIREAELQARTALDLLRTSINTMTDGFSLFDRDDRLVMCNERLTQIWAPAAQYLRTGALRADIRARILELGGIIRVNGKPATDDSEAWGNNTELEREDGRWYEVRAYRGEDEALMVVTIDVTARKQLEQSQQIYRSQLEEQVAARTQDLERTREALIQQERLATMGRFSATVSHELRNPLGSARNACHILKRIAAGNEPLMKYVELIDREITHSVHIMNNLLETTRVGAPRRQPLGLKGLLDTCMEAVEKPSTMPVDVDISDAFEVLGDPDQLRQVLTNLLLNAIQANPDDGTVRITARQDGAYSDIAICDEGPGIEASDQEKIFEPLYSNKATGSGLGLWISREIARRHGGELSVAEASEQAQNGACLTLRLPNATQSS